MYDNYARDVASVLEKTDKEPFNKALELIMNAIRNETPIHIFGNGGSAATASHFVTDWRKGIGQTIGVSAPVYCLTDNVPLLTAFSNDMSYEDAFAEMLSISAKKNDIALAITGSGNSKNVVRGVRKANEIGCKTIALTGFDGGIVGKIVSLNCHVPSNNMQIVEDVHSTFGHAVVRSIMS